MGIRDYTDWASYKWMTSHRINQLRTLSRAVLRQRGSSKPLLILGCQRSGTTMMSRAFGLSPYVKEYGEGDPAYFNWDGAPRLRPLRDVARQLSSERSRFVLLKPLCESQRTRELIENLPSARAVWIYRNYRECIDSHVRYYRQFHDGAAYVREMLAFDVPSWKNENLSTPMKAVLESHASATLSLESTYALYWLARNSFAHRLDARRVKIVKYENVLSDPALELEGAFQFLGVPFRRRYARIVGKAKVTGRPSAPQSLDPQIAEQCQNMLDQLDHMASQSSSST